MKITRIDSITVVQFREEDHWFIYERENDVTHEKVFYNENPPPGAYSKVYCSWQTFFGETCQTIKNRINVGVVLWERSADED